MHTSQFQTHVCTRKNIYIFKKYIIIAENLCLFVDFNKLNLLKKKLTICMNNFSRMLQQILNSKLLYKLLILPINLELHLII